jgi:hypothetical protein
MAEAGGIKIRNLHAEVQARLLAESGLAAMTATRPGVRASVVLNLPANVANGDVFTVDGTTFEIDIINTDSGVNTVDSALGVLADEAVSLLTLSAAPATAIDAGNLVRVESEIMKVARKLSTTQYVVIRGRCGTAIAAHLQNLDVIVSDAAPASNVPVGLVTTLTPAVAGPAIIEEFNNLAAGGERATAKAPPTTLTDEFQALPSALGLGAGQEILFVAREAGANLAAVSEEFANSTDNVWSAATFTGGVDPAVLGVAVAVRVPTAVEELLGQMHVALPFTPRAIIVEMKITSTGQRVFFNGAVLNGYVESTDATLPATIVTLRNVGPASTAYITPFAVTHTITVIALE